MGARLVLSAVTEQQRIELAGALDTLADRWQRRRNPLFVPLDDEAAEVERLLVAWLPATTAAFALSAGRWQSSQADLSIRGVARCMPARVACG